MNTHCPPPTIESPDIGTPAFENEAYPPDCDPNRYLDWRLRYAMHLVNSGIVVHEDPWIQAAIDFQVACSSRAEARQPTDTERSIYDALRLWQSDSLARYLLEARLIAQQSPEMIARRSAESPEVIEAYANLAFDVRGADRKGIWLAYPLSSGMVFDTDLWRFGFALKQAAFFDTSEQLESMIDVLLRVKGKTLFAGLPPRSAPQFARELTGRLDLAKFLLPDNSATARLLERHSEACLSDLIAGRVSQPTIDLALKVLRRARVPESLREEIQRVRAQRKPATIPAVPVDEAMAQNHQPLPATT